MSWTGVLLIEPLGRGGVWEYTCRLGNALQRHVQVAILTASDHDPHFLEPRVTVLPYVHWQHSDRWHYDGVLGAFIRKSTNAARYLRALYRALRTCPAGTFPLVHFQGLYSPPLVFATTVAARCQVRHVAYTPHNSFSRSPSDVVRWAWRWWQRWICDLAEVVIVHTAFDRKRLIDARISSSENVHVIPQGPYGNSTATVSQELARQRLGLSPSTRYVLLFGYLRPDKGLSDLLAVLPRLISEMPAAKMLVAGEDESGVGARLIAGLGAHLRGHVEFRPGFVPSEQVPDYFAASDVVCLPYRQASDSAVARWALAQRRPIVAYDVGGLRDALAGETLVRWVQPSDRRGLLRELVSVLCAHDQPAPTQPTMPGGSLLTWSDIAQLTLDRYRACLSRTGR